MEKKKKDSLIVELDSSKIVEAILKELETDDYMNRLSKLIIELLDQIELERSKRSADSPRNWKINGIHKFVRSKIIKNYKLVVKKLYNIRLKVVNKEKLYELLRYIIKQVGEIGIKEIIKIIIVEFMDSIIKRREYSKTSFYYV